MREINKIQDIDDSPEGLLLLICIGVISTKFPDKTPDEVLTILIEAREDMVERIK